jgi:hypothetical protein
VLRKHDILFVADEVICGFARTGEMWGSTTFGIRPDMMTSAKQLSAAKLQPPLPGAQPRAPAKAADCRQAGRGCCTRPIAARARVGTRIRPA